MNRFFKFQTVLLVTCALIILSAPASAQIDLRFTPADTTIEPSATTRVSVMLDDAVYFRTIELTVTYDAALIQTVSGGPGNLFSDSGFFIWEGFEESVPGQWHGFAIVMGATDSLSGPGELFAWEVEGLVEGTTPITSIETLLYAPNASTIPGVTLDPTTLRVRFAPSAVGDLPSLSSGLALYPNPFNPGTRVSFELPTAGHVFLRVFDARGRSVAVLHDGFATAGLRQFDWDGKDDSGRAQPGGVYLFRLDSQQQGAVQSATTKGILLK